jgi:hypothetical protein
MTAERPMEVTYEFIQPADVELRLQHAMEILASSNVECLAKRIVVPSDEIGESDSHTNIQIKPKSTANPSRHRSAYER